MDKAHKWTEARLKKMEKRIWRIYNQANTELRATTDAFARQYLEADEEKRKEVKEGKLTEKAYQNWQKEITRTNRFAGLCEDIAKKLLHAAEISTAYSNSELPEIYSHNYNFFDGASKHVKGYSFNLTNADVVRRLSVEYPNLLPYKEVNGKKHVRWNIAGVKSAALQGILQGESMQKIAKRMRNSVGMKDMASAMRNARTSVTSAECKGRQDSYERAEDDGLNIRREWVATLDDRTRSAHGKLDGQTVGVKEPFKSELGPIMYPGDPRANPANVYNCRCTVIAVVGQEKAESRIARDKDGKSVLVENMSYEEWQNWREKPKKKAKEFSIKDTYKLDAPNLKKVMGETDFKTFSKSVEKSKAAPAFSKYVKEVKAIHLKKSEGGSCYEPWLDSVTYSYDDISEQNKYETLAHELGHSFDARVAKDCKFTFKEILGIKERCDSSASLECRASSSDAFLASMREDRKKIEQALEKDRAGVIDAVYRMKGSTGVQDAFDGFFGTQDAKGVMYLPWGHGNRYYNRIFNGIKSGGHYADLKAAYKDIGFDVKNMDDVKQICRSYDTSSELWANITSAYACGGDVLKCMKKYFPGTCKFYEKTMEDISE